MNVPRRNERLRQEIGSTLRHGACARLAGQGAVYMTRPCQTVFLDQFYDTTGGTPMAAANTTPLAIDSQRLTLHSFRYPPKM